MVLVASALLLAATLMLALYHRLRRRSEAEIDFIAFLVLFGSAFVGGLFLPAIEQGVWWLVFLQAVILVPVLVWGLVRLRGGSRGMSEREFLIVVRLMLIVTILLLLLAASALPAPASSYMLGAAGVLALVTAIFWRRIPTSDQGARP